MYIYTYFIIMHLYNETLFGHKQKETLPLVICDPCTNFKAFMLSERSQTEKEKYWIVSLTYELKKEA